MNWSPQVASRFRFRTLTGAAALVAAALGALGLAGWILDLQVLQALLPGRPVTTPNTGVGLILTATALYLLAPVDTRRACRAAGLACAAVVFVCAALTVIQYAFGVDLGIDDILPSVLTRPAAVTEWAGPSSSPVRPPVPTALGLMLLSMALLTIDLRPVRRLHLAELIVIAAGIVIHAVLTGHAYDAEILYQEPRAPATGTALPTAIALWLLATGILLARPDRGIMAIITSDRVGGAMARRLLAPAIAGPSLLGFVVVIVAGGETAESLSLSHALLATSSAAVAAGLTVLTAASLNRIDDARATAHAAERGLRLQLEALSTATTAISEAVARIAGTDLDALFLVVVQQAQALTSARHAALGLGTDPTRPFERWVHTNPAGPLTALSALRPREVERALASHYSRARGFLAIPILHKGKIQGHLYLVDKLDADGFTADDAHALGFLAERAGTALETARLYHEESLGKSWLQGVIDSMPEAMILIDPTGHLSHNKAACRFATAGARDAHDRCASPTFDLRDPTGAPVEWSQSPLMRALRVGEHCNGREMVAHDSHGHFVPVLVSASPLCRERGHVVGAVCVLQDISTLKQIEQLREQWTAVVAHDLRQPLSVIAMSAQALERSLPAEPVADRSIARIRTAVDRLIRMVRDLLDASRIETRRLTLERAPIDLTPLIAEVAARMDPGTDRRLHVRSPSPLPLVYADAFRIEQVFENLLSNAIKYGDPGTDVVIELHAEDNSVIVSTTNYGKGLDADEITCIFERFYRSRASNRVEGLGLGLYIARGLIEAHGGRIWVESAGSTTTFHFTLPFAQPD